MRRSAPLLLLLVVVSCAEPASVPIPTTPPPSGGAETTTAPTTGEATASCLEGSFTEDGLVGMVGEQEGDATHLVSIRWAAHPGCERVVVDLATEGGSPATRPGPVEAEVRRDLGIVRLLLPLPIHTTAVADTAFEGRLARRAFVVRSADGSLFLDIHLGEASLVSAFALASPARLVVDLRPGGTPLPPSAPSGDTVVVLTPRGDGLSYPLIVSGYARTFEANVVVRIRKPGAPPIEEVTTAADYVETWGAFSLTVTEGPEPPVTLFVGEDSARDGTEQGVELELGP